MKWHPAKTWSNWSPGSWTLKSSRRFLVEIEYDEKSIKNLAHYCRGFYNDDTSKLNISHEFERDYRTKSPILQQHRSGVSPYGRILESTFVLRKITWHSAKTSSSISFSFGSILQHQWGVRENGRVLEGILILSTRSEHLPKFITFKSSQY